MNAAPCSDTDPHPLPRLFDAHCHLQDERLTPGLDAFMERAAAAGVSGFLCCGSRESDWEDVQRIARRFPGVHMAFGLHPWYARERTADWLRALRRRLGETPAAVGEIGLDHALAKDTFAAQEEVFLAQLSVAAELGRPVSVHCRRAWGRMMELLDTHGWPPNGILFHSYSGGRELVAPLARRGAFFSFSGAITHGNNIRGRDAVPAVPADRLLMETDAPDLMPALSAGGAPAPGHGVNEPANLVHVANAIASLRNWSPSQTAALTTRNAEQFLALSSARHSVHLCV